MWDDPFDTSMLNDDAKLVVSCPDQDLERDFAAILEASGIIYPDGSRPLSQHYWERYKEDFCYYIRGSVVRYGSKDGSDDYRDRCTFYGEQQDDISEESFVAIIGN